MSDLVLVPAACYPVYPAIAARGRLPLGGITVDAGGPTCFGTSPPATRPGCRCFTSGRS